MVLSQLKHVAVEIARSRRRSLAGKGGIDVGGA
jgi:hypothetical protein